MRTSFWGWTCGEDVASLWLEASASATRLLRHLGFAIMDYTKKLIIPSRVAFECSAFLMVEGRESSHIIWINAKAKEI